MLTPPLGQPAATLDRLRTASSSAVDCLEWKLDKAVMAGRCHG